MKPSIDITTLTESIRTVYENNSDNGQDAIEQYLEDELGQASQSEKQKIVEDLVGEFTKVQPPQASLADDEQLLRFCSLLLGRPVEKTELGADALQQKMSEALTTIFETLNQLIRTINLTLVEDGQTEETIRFLIGEQLDGSRDSTSLEEHLEQIRSAFVTSHRAFKMAVQITVKKILDELDPELFQVTNSSSFRIGPLRKADSFDRYSKTFTGCRQWYESGRCMQDFLRTFEKQCSEMARQPRR